LIFNGISTFSVRRRGFKPIQDSFTEDAGITGPYRNIANMGCLYLMVWEKRYSFLQFPSVMIQENPGKSWLKIHIRNKQGNITKLNAKNVLSEWDENSLTSETQPEIRDTCFSTVTDSHFIKRDWIAFLLPPDNSINDGLNIAITSPDSG